MSVESLWIPESPRRVLWFAIAGSDPIEVAEKAARRYHVVRSNDWRRDWSAMEAEGWRIRRVEIARHEEAAIPPEVPE